MTEFCRKSLNAFSAFLLRSCRAGWRRPKPLLAVLLLLSLVSLQQSARLRFLFSADDMIGEGIPSADELDEIKKSFDEGPMSLLWLLPTDGRPSFTQAELCAIRAWYSIARVTQPEIRSSISSFDLVYPVDTGPRTMRYRNVLDLDCREGTQPFDWKSARGELASAPWPFIHDKNERLGIVVAFTFKAVEGGKTGSFDPGVLKPLRDSVEKELLRDVPAARAQWAGSADYQWYVRQGFKFALVVNSAMILLLLFAFRLSYGTWLSGFLFCGTLVVSNTWVFGLKGAIGSPYDVLSSGLTLMLAVGSIEDFTFLSAEQMKGDTWESSVRKLLVPSFFTSFTTALGFLSLCVSDLAVIRRLGAFAAFGGMLEWVMVFGAIPALMRLTRARPRWVDPSRAWGFARVQEMAARSLGRGLSMACLVVFPAAIVATHYLNANDSPQGFFPRNHEFSLATDDLRDAMGWTGIATLLFRDGMSLDEREKIVERIERDPEASSMIAGIESPERIVKWLARSKVVAADDIQWQYSRSRVSKRLESDDGKSRALLYVKETTVDSIRRTKDAVARVCGQDCHLAGELAAYSDFSSRVPRTLIDSMSTSLVLVGLVLTFLAFAFGQQSLLLPLLLTSFWGPLFMVCLCAFFGISMDFMKSTVAAVLVGLAGDNAIQYLFASRRSDLHAGIEKRAGASIHTAFFMAATALMYLFSYFRSPKIFGLILCGGLLASLVGDLFLLNGFLKHFRFKRARTAAVLIAGALLCASASADGSFAYSIAIDPSGYVMGLELALPVDASLTQARAAFRDGALLSDLSPTVRSVENEDMPWSGDSRAYRSVMTVRSWGVTSRLVSHCVEGRTAISWKRECVLDTQEGDGGKYMVSKTDRLECKESVSGRVSCVADIRGKGKELRVLGIPLASAEKFMVRAKYQALQNFGRLFVYLADGAVAPRKSVEDFEKSLLSRELEHFLAEGLAGVASDGTFRKKAQVVF